MRIYCRLSRMANRSGVKKNNVSGNRCSSRFWKVILGHPKDPLLKFKNVLEFFSFQREQQEKKKRENEMLF